VVYAEQSRGFESLRAYAKWLDCREELSEFGPAPDNNYYEHPVWKVKGGTPSNPHLVAHDCFCGYYLPCDFDQMAMVEPYMIFGRWPASRSVGSTPRLLRALDRLRPELGDEYPPDDPLLPVKAAFRQLQQVAELSVEYALPIIFWG
jgi:hypothetical protein